MGGNSVLVLVVQSITEGIKNALESNVNAESDRVAETEHSIKK